MLHTLRFALLPLLTAGLLPAQTTVRPTTIDSAGPGAASTWPFAVGETMTFQGKFGFLPVGRADVVLEARDTVRGHNAWRSRFSVNGGPSWFGVHDNYTSWFDPQTLISYRYHQDIHEGRYKRNTVYDIY
ncbi:MAG TPA: DUF3108 domain-containing protein, partial [Gemmatimonadaceae bacterium]